MRQGMMISARTFALLALAGMVLAGCFESEKSCYDRLKADFDAGVEFAKGSCLESASRLDCAEYGLAAAESGASIMLIWMDDDQNACDYISDGERLARKR